MQAGGGSSSLLLWFFNPQLVARRQELKMEISIRSEETSFLYEFLKLLCGNLEMLEGFDRSRIGNPPLVFSKGNGHPCEPETDGKGVVVTFGYHDVFEWALVVETFVFWVKHTKLIPDKLLEDCIQLFQDFSCHMNLLRGDFNFLQHAITPCLLC